MIAEVVTEQRIPPWYGNSTHGSFANRRGLSADERATIVDTTTVDWLFHRLQQLIGLAYWVTATTTPFDDFTYLLSFEPTELPFAGYKSFRVEIHCHLTAFVSMFQKQCERELEGQGVEAPPDIASAPDNLELTMNTIGGRFVPYRISRHGPRNIWIRELITRPHQCPQFGTTSGLLVLLHAVLNSKTLIWDDFELTPETERVMNLLTKLADSHAFSFDHVKLDRSDPECWEVPGLYPSQKAPNQLGPEFRQ